MSVLTGFTRSGGGLPRIAFCESFDQRILRAAHLMNEHKLAKVVLLGSYDELDRAAVGYRTSLNGVDVVDHESAEIQDAIRKHISETESGDLLDPTDPVVAGAWLVRNGLADAVLAGAATTPTHVMRVYLRLLGMADDCATMSGMSLVAFEGCDFVRNRIVGMADVSVVGDPTVEQLADIATQSAANYARMTQSEPRVAFLSFSTMGSSDHPSARKVRDAVALTRSRKPELAVDGEMQIDAALIPAVAGTKSPSSTVAGNANVLIFPSLDAGNIAIKIFQKFSGYRALGPVLQGLKYRGTYIPRASSAEDIIDQARLLTS
ncbi:MAG: phosphate acyltransferase [Armatimonadota bacterium]|nr:phosphate acyltransferase [Armatimonadota bacterium]